MHRFISLVILLFLLGCAETHQNPVDIEVLNLKNTGRLLQLYFEENNALPESMPELRQWGGTRSILKDKNALGYSHEGNLFDYLYIQNGGSHHFLLAFPFPVKVTSESNLEISHNYADASSTDKMVGFVILRNFEMKRVTFEEWRHFQELVVSKN